MMPSGEGTGSKQETHPTSRSSMVPGWKGGKALPFGGSFGEYSLNDFEEQPRRERKKGSLESLLGALLEVCWTIGTGTGLLKSPSALREGDYPREHLSPLLNLAPILSC